MALSSAIAWECRTTGSATNGGGFRAGATGTDWTQQDSPQYSVTDAVTAGSTTITSASAAFGTDVVGGVAYVAGGTGSVVGAWYEITARASSTSITVDRATGLTAGTGVTLKIGGAVDHPKTIAAAVVASNKVFVKTGTYSATATITFSAAQAVVVNTTMPTRLIGYAATRGDIAQASDGTWTNNASRPLISLATNTGLTALSFSNGGWVVENMAVDCNSLGSSIGINLDGNPSVVRNCKVSAFASRGIVLNSSGQGAFDCEVTGCTSGGQFAILMNAENQSVVRCYVHDNDCVGIYAGSSGTGFIEWNLLAGNTGASSDGIYASSNSSPRVLKNTVHGSGRDAIRLGSRWWGGVEIRGNILSGSGGYGLNNGDGAGTPAAPWLDGNAYWSNTSGNRNNVDDTTANPINGVAPYTNVRDVILTGDPYVAKASNDFRLNSTAGAGAACRAVGSPRAWAGNAATVGYPDMGAAQHQDAGGGSTTGISRSRIMGGG